jgi:hypothetical protein
LEKILNQPDPITKIDTALPVSFIIPSATTKAVGKLEAIKKP